MKALNLLLKKYLLGNLDERESENISLQIIEDKSFETKMLIAENELIEDFLEDSLTSEETKLFYANFLTSEDRKNQLETIFLLKKYAKSEFQQKIVEESPKEKSDSFWEKVKVLFSTKLSPATVILTVLLICLIAGIAWRIFLYSPTMEMTQLEKEFTEINQKDLNNLPELSALTSVPLTFGTLRSSDTLNKLDAAKLTDKVVFRLALPFEITGKEFLKAELIKDQKVIFTQNQARIYKNQNGQEVKLILPKSELQKGQNQIRLENPNTEDSPINYVFGVE